MGRWAREDLIDSWDNTGFQIGDSNRDIKRVLIALDIDRMVVDKAIEEDYHMIISHHPLIFKPLKSITDGDHKEQMVLDIIKNDIVIYNAHSNLDLADKGVNDQLAKLLDLRDISILSGPIKDTLDLDKGIVRSYGYGRIGKVKDVSMEGLLARIKEKLEVDKLIVYGDLDRSVAKLAVCGGSGSDFILDAAKKKADVYITGDVKYHEAQLAYELGLNIVDAGHFNTEKIILPVIKEYLSGEVGNKVDFKVVMESGLPQRIL